MNRLLSKATRSAYRTNWSVPKRLSQTSNDTCQAVPDVPGLSQKICKVPVEEVGPGASKEGIYKNPEYFCYDNVSYFEAELEMKKYRLPQPSNKKA